MRILRSLCTRVAVALWAASLAACGGGGSALHSNAGSASSAHGATVKIQILVPHAAAGSSSAARRRPSFFSPSIQSVSIKVSTNSSPTVANVTATSPGCVLAANGTSCTVSLTAIPGSDTFTITSYDQQNATGNVLSVGTLVATIQPGGNTINVTMNGVATAMSLSLTAPLVPNGSAATSMLVVQVYDPDGNAIIGPGNYADANGNALTIAVSDSDHSGATTIGGGASASVTSPSNASLTIASTGALASGTVVTFTASATGIVTVTAILGVGTPGGTIYVVDANFSLVNAYLPGSSGNVTPYRSILPTLTYPEQLTYDTAGNIYVTDDNGNGVGVYEERINVYAPNALGNATPISQIAGQATGLNGIYGIALDSANNIWVVNYASGSLLSHARRNGQTAGRRPQSRRQPQGAANPPFIGVFAAGANGNVAPLGEIQGGATLLSDPRAAAFDSSGNLWVTNIGPLAVYGFSSAQLATPLGGGKLNAAPAFALTGLADDPYALAFDSAGNMYVGQCGAVGTVDIFAPGNQTGTPIPNRILTGTNCPEGIGFDGAGNVYVSGYTATNNVVSVYPAGLTGSVIPTNTILGALPDDENCFAGIGVNAGRIDVLDNCVMALYSYPTSASGTAIPSRLIQGYMVYPGGIWEDASGNLYVSSWGGAAGGVAVFAPGANGYAQPIRYITEAGTTDPSYNPKGVVTDASGNLYALNDPNAAVLVPGLATFASGANGSSTPLTSITGALTTLGFPYGKPQLDTHGNIVVLNETTEAVDFFAPGSTGNIAPAQTISGGSTLINNPTALFVDAAGNVYVGQTSAATTEILVFAANSYGNIAPTRIILGAPNIVTPLDLWVDGTGAIYVAEAAAQIAIFAPGANGASGYTLIQGLNVMLENAAGIAVGL